METDSTQVTGTPISARGPRRGAVLGERYEIVDALDGDALGLTYKALDQESEAHVLFRLPAPGTLGERDARSLVTRLSPLVGIGGRTIARIRDVDREGALVFVVEPWPQGTTFRAILEARRSKGTAFSTAELLPVIVSLAEATLAIPEPWFHGDLRAHRVYVHAEGVRITGGFALSVLPGDAIVDALTDDVGLRRQFAPEVGDGLAGRPSDRWSVAALAWEALTGSVPEPGPKHAPPALGEVGKVLVRYLDPDPTLRPSTLELLVSALAKHAKMPVPKLAPEPFAVESEAPSDDKTQQLDPSELLPTDSGHVSLRSGQTSVAKHVNDTAKMQALTLSDAPTVKEKDERDLSDIDPGLLKAAALNRKMSSSGTFQLDAKELEPVTGQKRGLAPKTAGDSGELDPRLVRAALGLDDGTDPGPETPKGRGSKKAGVTQELDALDLEALPAKARPVAKAAVQKPAPVKSVPPAKSIPPAREMPKPAAQPAVRPPVQPAVQPAVPPRPMVQPAVQPMVQPAVQPMMQHAPIATAPPANVPAPRPFAAQAATQIDRPERRERSGGTMIIAIAVGVAVTILVFAFWFRSSQQEAAHQRQIDERVRQIQQGP